MKTIVNCKILKTDIVPGISFMDWTTCPITKAVQRAGIEGEHGGRKDIHAVNSIIKIGKLIDTEDDEFVNKVAAMCRYVNGITNDTGAEPTDIEFQVQLL